jgi:hypothetical protein
MLDLVKNETERIESRFLEPCGDGNFLALILERKLDIVKKKLESLEESLIFVENNFYKNKKEWEEAVRFKIKK